MSPPYHLALTGQGEKIVQYTNSILKHHLAKAKSRDWDKIIKEVQSDLRFAQSDSLNGLSPAKLYIVLIPTPGSISG